MALSNAERQKMYRDKKRAEGLRRDWTDTPTRLHELEEENAKLKEAIRLAQTTQNIREIITKWTEKTAGRETKKKWEKAALLLTQINAIIQPKNEDKA